MKKRLDQIIYGNEPFLITRPGRLEMDALVSETPPPKMYSNAGFYCKSGNLNEVFHFWKEKYKQSLVESDRVLIVPQWYSNGHMINTFEPIQKKLDLAIPNGLETYPTDPKFYIDYLDYLTNSDKKVLIIFPFKESFDRNIKRMHEIYKTNSINSDNIDMVQSYQSISGNNPHANWQETYEIMIEEIEQKEFDVALLSCGCYGHPLALHIRSVMNKSAFYIGGRLQLMFGILGKRWLDRTEVTPYKTDAWSAPLPSERPLNYNNVERGCYW